MERKSVKNTIYVLAGKAVAALSAVILDISVARSLTVDEYGEWTYFFTVQAMLFLIVWFGIDASARVYVSGCSSDVDIRQCTLGGIIVRLVYSVVIALLMSAIMPYVTARFLGYPLKYPHLLIMMKICVDIAFLSSIVDYIKEWCVGLQKYGHMLCVTVVEHTGYAVLTPLFLYINRGIYAPVWAYLVSETIALIAGYIIIHDKIKIPREGYERCFGYARDILKYSVPLSVTTLGGMILIEADTFMLGLMRDGESVAVYGVAKYISSKIIHINLAIVTATMAPFSIITRDNCHTRKGEFKKITIYNALITLCVCAVLFFLGKYIIVILYGTEYVSSARMLRILCIYYVMYALSMPYNLFLDYRGDAGIRGIVMLLIALLNIIMNYVLIPKYGGYGAAVATNVSFVPYVVVVYTLAKRRWREIMNREILAGV